MKHPTWLPDYWDVVMTAFLTEDCPAIRVWETIRRAQGGVGVGPFGEWCMRLDPDYDKHAALWANATEKWRAWEVVQFLLEVRGDLTWFERVALDGYLDDIVQRAQLMKEELKIHFSETKGS